jgi:hypothetical protein
MQQITFLMLAAILFCGCHTAKYNSMNTSPAMLGKQDNNDGWQLLFDGKTTNGWHTYNKQAAGKVWKVEEGTLHLDAASQKNFTTEEGGDLLTDDEFDNFDLKLEWKISKNGNSGVMIFVKEDAKYEKPYFTGPEMQVLDNLGHPDGKIYKHNAGDLYDMIASTKDASKPIGEWNEAEVIANNGKLDFYLNGEHTINTTMWDDNWRKMVAASKFKAWPDFGTFKKGRIDLQDHGNDVWFRNIKIKKL